MFVIDTDPIYSDGHALLSWTINCNVLLKENSQQFQTQPTYKKWDAIHSTEFTENLPTERVRELCVNLKPNKDSINKATTEIANIFIETAKMTFPTQRKSYRTGNDKPWFVELPEINIIKPKNDLNAHKIIMIKIA